MKVETLAKVNSLRLAGKRVPPNLTRQCQEHRGVALVIKNDLAQKRGEGH